MEPQSFTSAITGDHILQDRLSHSMRNLNEFLSKSKLLTEKGDPKTNIINRIDGRTYHIPSNMLNDFFDHLDKCRKEKLLLHFQERQETAEYAYSGIMHDCDRYQTSREPQMTSDHLQRYTHWFSQALKSAVNFDTAGKSVTFMVFFICKPAVKPVEGDPHHTYKDGWHMLVPQIQIIKPLKKYIVNRLIEQGDVSAAFDDIDHKDAPEKMLDLMCSSVPVFFYGSCKPGSSPYMLKYAFRVRLYFEGSREPDNVQPIDIRGLIGDGPDRPPTGLAPGHQHPVCLTYELALGAYLESFNGAPTWLTKRRYEHKISLGKIIIPKSPDEVDSSEDTALSGAMSINFIDDPALKHIGQLLEILDDSYVIGYNKWFKVLCAIAHAGRGPAISQYKTLAIKFSQRCAQQWNPSAFEDKWAEAVKGCQGAPLTKASIAYWARQCSPQKYAEINKQHYGEKFVQLVYKYGGKLEHAHVASVLHIMLADKFVVDVDSTGRYAWYEFVTPGQSMRHGEVLKWRHEPNPDNLHIYIANNLTHIYDEQLIRIKDRYDNATNKNEVEAYKEIEKTLKKSRSALSSNVYQNGVVEQAKFIFRNRRFHEELDSYDDIIGVGNGLLKLGPTVEFVDGHHEYFVSKFTPTNYVPYDPEDKYVKTLLGAFRDIYPEPDVYEFILLFCSTMLSGKPAGVLLHAVGGGQNAKTFVCKMIHETLGEQYMSAGKTALLTSPTERAESHNSALMQLEGKRGFYFDETNPTDIINPSRLKSIINSGFQSARELHAKQKNFRNTATAFLLSNYELLINTFDHGTWRRFYYYRHKVKFCAEPNPKNKYERKEDKRFIEEYTRDPNYRAAMLAIMCHWYERLQTQYGGDITNIPVPTIRYETEMFRNKQDHVNRFITEMIVMSPSADPIPFSDLIDKYLVWYTREFREARTKFTTDNIRDLFMSSRLAPHLSGNKGMMFLEGHRIKLKREDPLAENERSLISGVGHVRPAEQLPIEIAPGKAEETDVDPLPAL